MAAISEGRASYPIDAKDILETIGAAVFALDRDLSIKYANHQTRAFCGIDPMDLRGRSIHEVCPGLDASGISRALEAVLSDGESRRFETVWPGCALPVEADIHLTGSGLLVYLHDVSARRRMAAELRERHEMLSLAESSAGIGVWSADLASQTVRGTEQFFRILGLPPTEEPVSMEVTRALRPAEDRKRVSDGYQQAVESGADVFESEYRIVRPDGEIRWIFGRGRVIRDAAGVPVHYNGVDIDITEKKAAEAALRESEDRFRRIFEQSPAGKAMAGSDFRLRAVNPALCQMLGYEADELVGRMCTDFVHPDDLENCLKAGRSLIEGTTQQIQMEERFIRKGGTPLWVRVVVGPIRDADGKLIATLGVLQDIDEYKRVLQALRNSEERLLKLNETLEQQAGERARQLASSRAQLQAFFDNSPDWLTLQKATPDGRFIYVDINPMCEAAYGLRREQVVGRAVEDILGPEAARVPLRHFLKCLHTGQPQRYVARRTMAGRTRTIDVVVVLVPGPGYEGNKFLITTARDVTDREDIEAQLRQSQKMEAVGHLTGGIAHDFNNLLTGISGNLELLRSRINAGRIADAPRYIEGAMAAAERAAGLTHRLLAFARRQPLDPEPLDVNLLMASMEDLLQRTLGPAIDLRMTLGEGLWIVLCDRNQLENAILNLAINARDVMPDGGRLIVETSNIQLDDAYAGSKAYEVKAGDYVAISVSDNGWGMTPEVASKVFEPFFTTKPLGKGTGLGLSMLYGFVKQSGGHVSIYSEVGTGTTVRVYLPRHGGSETSETLAQVSRPADGRHPRVTSGETVLLVEDEAPIRELISRVLNDLGYTIIEAHDGPSGLRELAARDRIDLLVTDVGLPGGLNGRQVADAARERIPGLKVLFITGFAHGSALGSNGSVLDPGMEILTKPFTLDAFAAKVNDMISRDSSS